MRLEPGSVAVVTGAASGLGRSISEALAHRGLSVAMLDLPGSALADAAASICDGGGSALALEVDVREAQSVAAAAAATVSAHGQVDLLVNNAGVIGPYRPVWEQEPGDWAWVHQVNLLGVVHGIRAFVPAMVERGSGHVLTTASVNAVAPIAIGGNGPYAASKAGVLAVAETLRHDLARSAPGVGVTTALPGPVETNIRSSERWRPQDLGSSPGQVLPPIDFGYERVSAEVAAERMLAAVEADRRYVFTNQGSERDARRWFDAILADA